MRTHSRSRPRPIPEVPTVALLRGELFEGLGKVDEAAAEYRLAWQQGMDSALPRLVTLLANHGKVDALAALDAARRAGLTLADIDEPSRAEYQAFVSALGIKP